MLLQSAYKINAAAMDLGGSLGVGLCCLPALPENQRMSLLGWCRCWAVFSSPEQHKMEHPHPRLLQHYQTAALSFPADGLEGVFKGCRQLVSFFN